MSKKGKFLKAIKEPRWGFGVLFRRYFSKKLNDETFIKWRYFIAFGKFPNLVYPQTFNEKLQWLKLHDKHEEYSELVDKYEVKNYICNSIGKEYVIPTLGVYNSFDEIDFDVLPNQFVLKTTHDSGGVVVCPDKNKLDINKAREVLQKSLRTNYFYTGREYPYKNLKPRIIAEKYMVDESGTELKDYKFFCFNGEPKYMLLVSGRQAGKKRFDYFDLNWNHLPVHDVGCPGAERLPAKPDNFEEMIFIAKKLSKGMTHVRVDLYNINCKIFFGELTFFDGSGLSVYDPREWDFKFGQFLKLPID